MDLFSPRLLLVPAFDVLDLSEFLNLLWAPTGRGSDLYLRGVSLALGSLAVLLISVVAPAGEAQHGRELSTHPEIRTQP